MSTHVLRGSFLALLLGATTLAGCFWHRPNDTVAASRVPKEEHFVLPAGYQGPLIVIYGQAHGVKPSWTSDTATYKVPRNGILQVAGEEPPHSTTTLVMYSNHPETKFYNFPTCADMRVYEREHIVDLCWLDFSVGGTGIPDHFVAVVTDWAGIPANFTRSTFVYDSVLFGGKGRAFRKWEEPKDIGIRKPIQISQSRK